MKQNDDWEVGNKSIGDWLSDFWQDLDNVLYFPKTTVIGIPALIFVSLFFVPDGYAGMTTYTKSITSSQQNKWLFDVVNKHLPKGVRCTKLEFWETSKAGAIYFEW